MGQQPVPPVNIQLPTKMDYNGWCAYPKMVPLVLKPNPQMASGCSDFSQVYFAHPEARGGLKSCAGGARSKSQLVAGSDVSWLEGAGKNSGISSQHILICGGRNMGLKSGFPFGGSQPSP